MYHLLLLAWGDDCFKTLFRVILSDWKLLYRKTKEVESITVNICPIASWHERPGLNPYELGSNRASHSGSNAGETHLIS
jgi:hypothetical protein